MTTGRGHHQNLGKTWGWPNVTSIKCAKEAGRNASFWQFVPPKVSIL